MMSPRLLVLLPLLLLATACGGTVGKATLLSSHPITPQKLAQLETSEEVVRGEVMVWVYLGFHREFGLEEAIEDALRKVPNAVALTDVTISDYFWWAGVGRGGFIIEGKPLIDKSP